MATKTQELRVTPKVAEKNGTGGISLLNDHFRNHDTAFTPEERNRYSLEGLFHSRGIATRRAASRSKSVHPWVAALERVLCLVEGTKPNLKKINEYVGRSLMLVTALSPVIGYDKSSKIAHCALYNDLTLKQAALKVGIRDRGEFDRVVDPQKMVHPCVAKIS